MNEPSRQQKLEQILQRFCRVKILHYDVIEELLLQLKTITTTQGDEEDSLLFIVRLSMKELRKCKKARTDKEKNEILRRVLRDTINDLTNHLRIYFPQLNSDTAV